MCGVVECDQAYNVRSTMSVSDAANSLMSHVSLTKTWCALSIGTVIIYLYMLLFTIIVKIILRMWIHCMHFTILNCTPSLKFRRYRNGWTCKGADLQGSTKVGLQGIL